MRQNSSNSSSQDRFSTHKSVFQQYFENQLVVPNNQTVRILNLVPQNVRESRSISETTPNQQSVHAIQSNIDIQISTSRSRQKANGLQNYFESPAISKNVYYQKPLKSGSIHEKKISNENQTYSAYYFGEQRLMKTTLPALGNITDQNSSGNLMAALKSNSFFTPKTGNGKETHSYWQCSPLRVDSDSQPSISPLSTDRIQTLSERNLPLREKIISNKNQNRVKNQNKDIDLGDDDAIDKNIEFIADEKQVINKGYSQVYLQIKSRMEMQQLKPQQQQDTSQGRLDQKFKKQGQTLENFQLGGLVGGGGLDQKNDINKLPPVPKLTYFDSQTEVAQQVFMVYRSKYNHRLLASMRLEELLNPIIQEVQAQFLGQERLFRHLSVYGPDQKAKKHFFHCVFELLKILHKNISPFSNYKSKQQNSQIIDVNQDNNPLLMDFKISIYISQIIKNVISDQILSIKDSYLDAESLTKIKSAERIISQEFDKLVEKYHPCNLAQEIGGSGEIIRILELFFSQKKEELKMIDSFRDNQIDQQKLDILSKTIYYVMADKISEEEASHLDQINISVIEFTILKLNLFEFMVQENSLTTIMILRIIEKVEKLRFFLTQNNLKIRINQILFEENPIEILKLNLSQNGMVMSLLKNPIKQNLLDLCKNLISFSVGLLTAEKFKFKFQGYFNIHPPQQLFKFLEENILKILSIFSNEEDPRLVCDVRRQFYILSKILSHKDRVNIYLDHIAELDANIKSNLFMELSTNFSFRMKYNQDDILNNELYILSFLNSTFHYEIFSEYDQILGNSYFDDYVFDFWQKSLAKTLQEKYNVTDNDKVTITQDLFCFQKPELIDSKELHGYELNF